jgi:hypothetical protein
MIKRKPLELPPEAARRFFEDMRAFHGERSPIKRDEIAARQLGGILTLLEQYNGLGYASRGLPSPH